MKMKGNPEMHFTVVSRGMMMMNRADIITVQRVTSL